MDTARTAADVPAPFDDLSPLLTYIDKMMRVVEGPSPEHLADFIAYDRDAFTPVVMLYPRLTYNNRSNYNLVVYHSCILYDYLEPQATKFIKLSSSNSSDVLMEKEACLKALRHHAAWVLHHIAIGMTETCAFPFHCMKEGFEEIDETFEKLLDDDSKQLAKVRRSTSLKLLNKWTEAKYFDKMLLGRPDSIVKFVEIGWRTFGMPYRTLWLTKFVGSAVQRLDR